jgi:hypothetical protein
LPEFEGPEKIVIRRYSDFEWLHDRLAERYKGIFIPPLPEKNAVGKVLNYDFASMFSLICKQEMSGLLNNCANNLCVAYCVIFVLYHQRNSVLARSSLNCGVKLWTYSLTG